MKTEKSLASKPRIGVVGPGSCPQEISELAYRVGHGLAAAGAILICGGRGGVMEAAAKGAKEAGGITVGILPGDSPSEANPYIDIPIVTGLGNARNVINVLTSQAIIAVCGEYGTLSEIAFAMKCGIPIVGLNTWKLTAPNNRPIPMTHASTPEKAVRAALSMRVSCGVTQRPT
ncbi:MAG: TIGR00725 family protein [Acidobacteria bacterium]|nr:TIGR00725 family protein [Acidobacteriota bacterium]